MPDRNRLHHLALGGWLAVFLSLSAVDVSAQEQGQNAGKGASTENDASERRTEPKNGWDQIPPTVLLGDIRSAIASLEAAIAKQESPDKDQREKEDLQAQQDMALWAFWMVIGTLAQVLVGFIGVWFVKKTLERNEEAIQATKVAAEAAVRAAEAAERATEISHEMSQRELRAYLMTDFKDATYQDRATQKEFSGLVAISNMGATPARNVAFRIKAGIYPFVLPPDFKPDTGDLPFLAGGTVGHGQIRTMRGILGRFINDREAIKVRLGDGLHLYVWGTVTYEDVFGGSWETNFCHRIMWAEFVDPKTKERSLVPQGFHIGEYESAT